MSGTAETIPVKEDEARYSLAGFQQQAMEGLQDTVKRVAWYHEKQPEHRREISLKSGVMLLQSPTGSGKTLTLGRTIEGLRGQVVGKVVWFWFAPYAGLVAQTRDALNAQCGSLRLRDIYTDRESSNARDGDVFVQTWASMASRKAESRKVRRTSERVLSVDDMLENLRADGFHVGVIIDEAHLNFGASASAAASLYLDVLRPDFTVLATATPNDDKLEAFERSAGIEVASRVVIERGQVVDAGLNKVGLMLGYLRFNAGDEKLIDLETATLTAAWSQHKQVQKELQANDIGVVPLMLVQVEDQAKGAADPIERVRTKLERLGVPKDAIRSHTSGEPDPEFHSLAFDPQVQVLIFKVSVATGFDAPRAWTLVSVRPSRGKDFGLQIVGRIMRVHPSVRHLHKTNPKLDNGYVFLADPNLQAGLDEAVDDLKAVRQGIELLTDRLDVVEFGNSGKALPDVTAFKGAILAPVAPVNQEERQQRLNVLVSQGLIGEGVKDLPPAEQDKAIISGEYTQSIASTGLFGEMPHQFAPQADPKSSFKPDRGAKRYLLRADLGIPKALVREELPKIYEIQDKFVEDIAKEFCSPDLLGEINRVGRQAQVSLKDLFNERLEEQSETINVRLSNARVMQEAQLAFEFNNQIDPRKLRQALVARLTEMAEAQGYQSTPADIKRTIQLAVMLDKAKMKEALRRAQKRHMVVNTDEPIPEFELGPEGLDIAHKGAYGVFPANMNKEERAFAEFLDSDSSGLVTWWLRNPENYNWATRLILPNGKRFFPDFAVGIIGRKSKDHIALVEIKDDGDTGRLHSDSNLLKIKDRHTAYQNVFWTYRAGGKWVEGAYNELENRIIANRKFEIENLVMLN